MDDVPGVVDLARVLQDGVRLHGGFWFGGQAASRSATCNATAGNGVGSGFGGSTEQFWISNDAACE